MSFGIFAKFDNLVAYNDSQFKFLMVVLFLIKTPNLYKSEIYRFLTLYWHASLNIRVIIKTFNKVIYLLQTHIKIANIFRLWFIVESFQNIFHKCNNTTCLSLDKNNYWLYKKLRHRSVHKIDFHLIFKKTILPQMF